MSAIGKVLEYSLPTQILGPVRRFKHNWLRGGTKSYSQEGEDVLLSKIFDGTKLGFYVDVGAHHPVLLSNTYRFYRQGWRGINIDPLPGTERAFKLRRPRDMTFEMGISEASGTWALYMFDWPQYDTFGSAERDFAIAQGRKLIETRNVKVDRLDAILSRWLPFAKLIEFMTIDVEGHEEEVLNSNDWERYRPKIIILEIRLTKIDEALSHPLTKFLRERGYSICAKLDNSVFYQERNFCYSERDYLDSGLQRKIA